jgi:ABC-type transport system involved in multi-copper enzyme maturation permease subunit
MSTLAERKAANDLPLWRLLAIPAAVLVGGAAGWFAVPFGPAAIAGALALLLGSVVFLLRPLLPPLFGPIFVYDLVGTARRGRYVVVRCLYIAALLVMLFLLYAQWFGKSGGLFELFTAERINRNDVSAFNDSFFQMFMAVQFLVIVLLTPGITAGAVAEEKDRRTLEFLLATDLHNHEIVFGKLAARLAYMTLVLLTGLPVLSLLQLLGGVDPKLMLAGFVATGVTMLSLAGLSILNSVYATKPRTAIALTYVQAAAYFAVTTCSLWLWDPGKMPWPAQWACAGNVYVALSELRAMVAPGGGAGGVTLVSGLPRVLIGYAGFHLAVTLLCLLASLVGLRLWARWQASGRSRKAYVIAFTQKRLPRVSGRPMLWKELYSEPLFRLGEAAQIIITTFIVLCLVFGAFVLISVVTVGLMLGNMGQSMNRTVCIMGTAVATLMVLGTAVRAAGAISGERDRQTMDTLLTTPIENDSIVWSKWWGSVLGVRKAGYCLLILWAVGAGTGGLSPLALPLLLLALFVYLGFAGSLGLWFSLRCRTTLRATIWTIVTLAGVSLGHWVLTFFCSPLMYFAQPTPAPAPGRIPTPGPNGEPRWTRLLSDVQAYSLTPPATMVALAFSNEELALDGSRNHGYGYDEDFSNSNPLLRVALGLVGIAAYGIAAIVLLLLTRARFTPLTGRLPLPGAVPRRPLNEAPSTVPAEGPVPVNSMPHPLRPRPPSAGRRFAEWLRHELSPAAFRRSWRPRLAVALLLAGAALLVGLGGALAAWQQAALWAGLVTALAVLARRGWLVLFGPVFFYDLVRTARQGRTFLLRGAYAVALLVVLFLIYSAWFGGSDSLDDLFGEVHVGVQELADFGARFFLTFVGVQFGAVFLLAPAFTANAIAEEKEKKTLDYLLATDLGNREIVLGKLASRLLTMLLLLMGGLPVLSFVQFLGGVDPNLVLAGFAATAVTMLSLGSLGILNSVYAQRPRGAVFSTYVEAGAYLLFSSCCGGWVSLSTVWTPLEWVAAGNIFVAYRRVTDSAAAAGGTTGTAVLSVLGEYVLFHAVVTVVLAGLATLKLRAWNREARPQSERAALQTRQVVSPELRARLRLPRVGDEPILWRELYAEHGYRLHPLARGLLTFLGGAFLFVAGLAYLCGIAASLAFDRPAEFATEWVRVVGTTVGCLMLAAVAVRASTGLSAERDRQTLDSLLTTPLSNRSLLSGKWLGSLLSVRLAWWCLGAVWLLGFLAGGLHVLSALMLLASWWVYAAFAAGLGLWFSLHCRTSLRATAWTLLTLLVAGGVPFLLCGAVGTALLEDLSPDRSVRLADLSALTPPGAMVYLAFGWGDWYSFDPALKASAGEVALAWAGVVAYALAAAALWFGVGARFGAVTGRMPDGRTSGQWPVASG